MLIHCESNSLARYELLALFAMGFALMGFGMKETDAFLDKK